MKRRPNVLKPRARRFQDFSEPVEDAGGAAVEDWGIPTRERPMTLAASVHPALTVRPVRLADGPLLQDFVQALDPASRRMRFHGAINACAPSFLRLLSEADGVRHVAFVALCDGPAGPLVGEARYVVNAEGDAAELAICVSDACRGQGVADALMHQLLEAARAAGLGWLYGDVLAGNLRMAGFMRRHGFALAWPCDAEAGVERWERAVGERPARRGRAIGHWLGRWLDREWAAAR